MSDAPGASDAANALVLYSVTQSCAALGGSDGRASDGRAIDGKTLHAWCALEGFAPMPALELERLGQLPFAPNRRFKYLTHAQLELLAARHGLTLLPVESGAPQLPARRVQGRKAPRETAETPLHASALDEAMAALSAALARIGELEGRNSVLEERVEQAEQAVRRLQLDQGVVRIEPLPDGYVAYTTLLEQHGVDKRAADRLVKRNKLPHPLEPPAGVIWHKPRADGQGLEQRDIKRAYPPTLHAAVAAVLHEHWPDDFRLCGPSCPERVSVPTGDKLSHQLLLAAP